MDLSTMEFERDGLLLVPAAFDPTGMVDAMWHALASRHRIERDDPSTWPVGWFGKLTKFGRSGPFAGVATSVVDDALRNVFGGDWHEHGRWGQPLITFPTPDPWVVPNDAWHLDFPPSSTLEAVRMFAYLTDVAAGGGGTVIVSGSHRLAAVEPEGTKSAVVRSRLAERSPWFRDLWRPVAGEDRTARFMDDGDEVDGVAVRVVELTGAPGDVILWHPSLLHGATPNCRPEPRFMLTHTALRGPTP